MSSGKVTNVRLDATPAKDQQHDRKEISGQLVAINASEMANGADLNGDGDLLDTVGYAVDWVNGRVHKGLTGAALPTSTSWMPMVVDELEMGVDYNQDGDQLDHVLAFMNFASGTTWNTGLAVSWHRQNHGVSSGYAPRVVAEISEFSSGGTDLNGDGDATDFLLVRFDPAAQTMEVTKAQSGCEFGNAVLASRRRYLPPVDQSRVFACVYEYMIGTDLNKDGDLLDLTAHVWDMDTWEMVADLGALADSNGPVPKWLGNRVYLQVLEREHGEDYNGDGSLDDVVVARWDLASGAFDVVPYAVRPSVYGPFWAAGTHEVFVGVWEPDDGRDLNGDGDTYDAVLHVVR